LCPTDAITKTFSRFACSAILQYDHNNDSHVRSRTNTKMTAQPT
jgi:hypothetical protein